MKVKGTAGTRLLNSWPFDPSAKSHRFLLVPVAPGNQQPSLRALCSLFRRAVSGIWMGIMSLAVYGASSNLNQARSTQRGGDQVRSGGDSNKLRANVPS